MTHRHCKALVKFHWVEFELLDRCFDLTHTVEQPANLCTLCSKPLCSYITPEDPLFFSDFWLSLVTCWMSLSVLIMSLFFSVFACRICCLLLIVFCKALWTAFGFEMCYINTADIDFGIRSTSLSNMTFCFTGIELV